MTYDSKGMLLGGEWFAAKEMWSGGWLSWVATRVVKPGWARSELITGVIERPFSTARAPF